MGSILDLGCGLDLLQKKLSVLNYKKYVGVDMLDNAIKKATINKPDNTEYYVCKIEEYTPDESFDYGGPHWLDKI
jgi:2-polyprenyl-3-methyl-5-hydroxy-6-metoxy-1,4-benzoquinol methylase